MSVQIKGVGTIGGLDEGLNITGIVTATSFVGSGANLTNLPAQATIANNADNRVITGGSGVNLNAESNLTYNGQKLNLGTIDGGSDVIFALRNTNASGFGAYISGGNNNSQYILRLDDKDQNECFRVTGDGNVGILNGSPQRKLHIGNSGYSESNIRLQGGADYAELRVKDSDNAFSIHTNIAGAGSREALSISGNTGHVNINAVSYQALTITTSENGTNGPEVQLIHNSTSPAVGDNIGQLRFSGKDTAGNTTLYSKIETKVDDPSNGTEGGHLEFSTRGGGAYNSIFRLKARGTASTPNYTTDDMNGIILDTYNTGNPYPRYFNFIAKSAGNTASNIGFWTEAVGGSPTEKMRISADGYVLKPSMPSFFVHGSPSMGTNTGYSYIAYSFSNVKHNTGGHYANNTGRFTAPVAGVYYFCGGLWSSIADQSTGQHLLVFRLNNVEAGVACNHRTYQNQLVASMVISLSANDIITLGYGSYGGTIQGSTPRNYFCGYLIG